MRARARELSAWAAGHDPAGRAAELVEGFAAGKRAPAGAATRSAETPRGAAAGRAEVAGGVERHGVGADAGSSS
jgi:hypothetical protein